MNTLLLLFLLIGHNNHSPTFYDNVDEVEFNNVYDDKGELVIRQLIFKDWNVDSRLFNIVAWRLVSKDDEFYSIQKHNGLYTLIYNDSENTRLVQFKTLKRTWTQFDPEFNNRYVFPKSMRRGLLAAQKP